MDLLELHFTNTGDVNLERQFGDHHGIIHVFVGMDVATKWPTIACMTNKEPQTVACVILNEIVPVTGVPRRILTDEGGEFVNSISKYLEHKALHNLSR